MPEVGVTEDGVWDESEDGASIEDQTFDSCRKVLEAGVWLIRNGYGRMGLVPYASPSGAYWRCEFQPIGRISKAFFRYSSSSGARYLAAHCGGSVRRTISAKSLGKAILTSVPSDVVETVQGEATAETLAWLRELEGTLDRRYLPCAFQEYTEDYTQWDLVSLFGDATASMKPQPGYVPPGDEASAIREPFWRESLARWESLSSGARSISLPMSALNDNDLCFELAHKLRVALNDVESFEAPALLRGIVAALHAAHSP